MRDVIFCTFMKIGIVRINETTVYYTARQALAPPLSVFRLASALFCKKFFRSLNFRKNYSRIKSRDGDSKKKNNFKKRLEQIKPVINLL